MLLRPVRGALRLALSLLAGAPLHARPALACEGAAVPALAAAAPLSRVERYELAGELLLPFLGLWQAHGPAPLPEFPDLVTVFAAEGRPLLVVYGHRGCLLGALPVPREEVWAALRRTVGPVA